LGFNDVSTYINSGNVIFTSEDRDVEAVTKKVEKGLVSAFDLAIPVVVVSHKDLKTVVDDAPRGFGKKPEEYRYDVIFLKAPLTSAEVLEKIPLNPEVDAVKGGKHAVYHWRLIEKASKSKISRIVAMPMYKNMTIRNWNTTTKLLALSQL
jgi:uncharacterized protein (DUF1697 family)